MAQMKDVIEVERRRETRGRRLTIHLFCEGGFFWFWIAIRASFPAF